MGRSLPAGSPRPAAGAASRRHDLRTAQSEDRTTPRGRDFPTDERSTRLVASTPGWAESRAVDLNILGHFHHTLQNLGVAATEPREDLDAARSLARRARLQAGDVEILLVIAGGDR